MLSHWYCHMGVTQKRLGLESKTPLYTDYTAKKMLNSPYFMWSTYFKPFKKSTLK